MFKSKSSQKDSFLIDTLIGPQATVHGDVTFSGGLCVEGRIHGNVRAADSGPASLILAEQGYIEGEVTVPLVVINGQLVGDVHADERVELAAKARVEGNVHYRVVEMNAGAQLNGCLMHMDSRAGLPAPDDSSSS
jgi:cytoskeletal protein CcmA (bactofilin family)